MLVKYIIEKVDSLCLSSAVVNWSIFSVYKLNKDYQINNNKLKQTKYFSI